MEFAASVLTVYVLYVFTKNKSDMLAEKTNFSMKEWKH